MPRRHLAALSCAILALATNAAAGDAPAPRRALPPVTPVERDDLVVQVLDNGACVAARRAATEGVVSVQIWVGAGSITEGERANHGISHFVEHMLFEGTAREPGRGFDALVRSLGGVHNGYTSLAETVYHVTVPAAGYRRILRALVEMASEAAIPPERFERERSVILRELRQGEDDVARLAGRLVRETVYRVHPYRHRIGGAIEEFSRLTHEDLVAYYKTMYVPGNVIVVAAGDVDVREAVAELREAVSKIPAGPVPDISHPREPEQAAPRFAHHATALARNTRITFAWRTVDLLHPDLHALDVLAIALGQGRASRLTRALKEERGAALDVGAYSWTPQDDGYLGVWVQCEPDRAGEVRVEVARQIDAVRTYPLAYDELERARSTVEANAVFGKQTAESVASDLASNLMFTGDPDFSAKYLAGVKAVTADDILRVARTYLVDARSSVVELRPAADGAGSAAAGADRSAAAPAASGRGEPEVRDLSGGGRLVLVRDDSLPMVSVAATLMAGLRLEPAGRQGVSSLLSELVAKGTRRRSGEQLAKDIEGRGGSFSSVSGRNSLSVQVQMLSADLGEAVEAAAEMLCEPSLAAHDIERVRTETLAAIRARAEKPWGVARELLNETLFEGHPYQWDERGTAESIESIARRDLLAFHRAIARRGNLVVSIAGRFDPEAAESLVRGAFRRMPAGALVERAVPAVTASETRRRVERTLAGTQSVAMMWGFLGPRLGERDADALAVAAEMLGGMSGRLWNAVREDHGLAYMVGAFSNPQLDPGVFAVYCMTKPEGEAKVLALIERELATLAATAPGERELADAKAGIVGESLIALQSRQAIALQTALFERYGLTARAALDASSRLERVTAEDVRRVVGAYLKTDGGVLAVVKP